MAEDTAPEAAESQAADQQEAAAPSAAGPKVSAENLRVLENIEVQMTCLLYTSPSPRDS